MFFFFDVTAPSDHYKSGPTHALHDPLPIFTSREAGWTRPPSLPERLADPPVASPVTASGAPSPRIDTSPSAPKDPPLTLTAAAPGVPAAPVACTVRAPVAQIGRAHV